MRRAAALLLALGLALGLAACSPPFPEIQDEAKRLVDGLEAYRAEHELYPRTLEAAGLEPREERFGGFLYVRTERGASYELWIGDAERDGLEMRWSPRDR